MYMHVFYKKYKHISLYSAFLVNLSFSSSKHVSSAFLWVYKKYKNNFLVRFCNYLTALAQCWANDEFPTITSVPE